jgi:putative phage-type endonuclease
MTQTIPETRRYRPTPTGLLVTKADPGTPEWFAARRGGITGTDLPKIIGDSKYGNALSVYLDKRDEIDDAGPGEAADWGTLLEDVVAREWARRNDVKVSRVGVIEHVENTHYRASLDRRVHGCSTGDRCGLEVKTRSAYKRGTFTEDIPDDVLGQTAWGRMVSGYDHMHVAVLVGGQELFDFTYERDSNIERVLVEEAQKVWDCVATGTPPIVEGDSDGVLLDILNRMYSRREGDRDVDAEKAAHYLAEYARGHELETDGKKIKTAAKGSLVQLLDDGDTALLDGTPAYTYKRPKPSSGMPADEVRRLAVEDPDLYERLEADGFIVTSQAAPRFTVKKG